MKTKTIKLSTLIPNPENPRFIKDSKFDKLVKSITEFPKMLEMRPMIIDENNIILGGNMRFKALQHMGYKEIPASWISVRADLTPEEKKEFLIKDNINFGEWDTEELANNWNHELLTDWGADVPQFIPDEPEPEVQEDDFEVPDEIQTDIKLGDLFEIGNHRLLCGDSMSSFDVSKLMNNKRADLVFTDPPYGVSYTGGHNKKKRTGIQNDTLQGSDLTDLFYASISLAYNFSKDHAAFYIWYANGKAVETFASFAKIPLKVRAVICWYKVRSGLGAFMSQYIPNYEPCIYAHKEGHSPQWFGPTDEKTVWELKKDSKNEYHPTQKPIELPSRAIKNSSKEKDIILDLFGGSGSTMVASEALKRDCYIMELDPKYCQVIINRMLKLKPDIQITKNGQPYIQ